MRTRMAITGVVLASVLMSTLPLPAAAAAPPIPLPGTSDRIDAIRQRGFLRVAVLDEYPWLKKTATGAGEPFEGAAWLLAETYARRLGVELVTTKVGFGDKVSVLSDRADITIAPLLVTPDRAASFDLITYSQAAHCLFGRASNPKVAQAVTIDDLDRPDVTVGFIDDTPQGEWVKARLPSAARRGMPGTIADLATREVLAGTADVAPIDQFFFAAVAAKVPGLVTIPKGVGCLNSTELPIPIGMAISKGQPVFLNWLREEARFIGPQLDAEQRRVVAEGP